MQIYERLLAALRRCCETVPDNRRGKNATYAMADFALAAFAPFFLQSPSFLAHQRHLETGQGRSNCQTLFGMDKIPGDSQIRAMLDPVDPAHFHPMFAAVMAEFRQSGGLDAMRCIDGRMLIALDGTEYHCSDKIHCPNCSHRKRGKGKIEYFHTMLAAAVVARAEPGVVGHLLACRGFWCQIDAKGYRGWVERDEIFGVLPNEQFGQFQINPFKTWLVVVAVSAVSYGSYVLQRLTKGQGGIILAALLGGAYSSTVTTVVLARRSTRELQPRLFAGGILIASGIMYLRLVVLLGLFNHELMLKLAPSFLILAGLATGVGWLWSRRPDASTEEAKREFEPKNPLELGAAFLFAFFFLAEYMNMFIVAAIGATMFLGGWMPLHIGHWQEFNHIMDYIPSIVWFFGKTFFVIYLIMWFKWTFPRLRIDQLLNLEWKYLLPLSLINTVLIAFIALMGWYF